VPYDRRSDRAGRDAPHNHMFPVPPQSRRLPPVPETPAAGTLSSSRKTQHADLTLVTCSQGDTGMGDKGKRDKGKREQQKKAKLSPKEKRKQKREKKDN